uniref:Uncharacterized protein n=1 Tax=Anguilla anguilla TaxID=7936 RepID=A0A0E9SAS2_ANGAN
MVNKHMILICSLWLIATSTIKRILYRHGLEGCRTRKEPLLQYWH